MAATLPRRFFLTHGSPASGQVCLTFDDGPHPVHTPRLLDVLRDQNVTATFFVIGSKARQAPDIVRRIAEEGHAVGHHTMYHTDPALTSTSQLLREIQETRRMLQEQTGKMSNLFRPPHGKLTFAKMTKIWGAGQRIVLWNVDPKDFACATSDQLRDRLERSPLRGGDIVLMHDNVAHAAIVLPELIDSVRTSGLSFVPVTRWIP